LPSRRGPFSRISTRTREKSRFLRMVGWICPCVRGSPPTAGRFDRLLLASTACRSMRVYHRHPATSSAITLRLPDREGFEQAFRAPSESPRPVQHSSIMRPSSSSPLASHPGDPTLGTPQAVGIAQDLQRDNSLVSDRVQGVGNQVIVDVTAPGGSGGCCRRCGHGRSFPPQILLFGMGLALLIYLLEIVGNWA
jgi:hypothetical protein